MTCLGLGLSFFHLAPAWLLKDYLVRGAEAGNFSSIAMVGVAQLPGLFLENIVVPGDITMSSTYLTLPALIILSFLPLRIFKQQWISTGILAFSLLMTAGPTSFFWFALTKFIAPMQYSRFPASDYRIFVAIMLIYFTSLALKAMVEGNITRKMLIPRITLVLFWFSQGIYVSYPSLRSIPVYLASAICLATLLSLTLFILLREKYSHTFIFLMLATLLLTSMDARRVLPYFRLSLPNDSMSTWQLPAISSLDQTQGWTQKNNNHLLTYEILPNMPERRPARIEIKTTDQFPFQSFITGTYTLNIYTFPNMLKSAEMISSKPSYEKFMLSKWTPLFFEDQQSGPDKDNNITIPFGSIRDVFREASDANLDVVRQIHYGINEIDYILSITRPILMVENEIYFPGWSATLKADDGSTRQIQAISVNKIFRAWQLPAGNYRMTAHFELPNLKIYNGISIVSLVFWMLAFVIYTKRQKIRISEDEGTG
jgi:hypothetical protein